MNLCPLAVIIYTDNLPDGVGGRANGPVVRIRPKYERDFGMLAHELEHVWQWWLTLGLHPILYALIKPYRKWAEASAYAQQTHHQRTDGSYMSVQEAAERLARPMYRLGMTQDQAEQAILRQL